MTFQNLEFYLDKELHYWRVKIPNASTIQKDFELVRFLPVRNTTGLPQGEFENYVNICQQFRLVHGDPFKRFKEYDTRNDSERKTNNNSIYL